MRLHVVLTADPEIPVPPTSYGGIERIVHSLVSELGRRGHRVTLFAHPDSTAPCELVAWQGTRSRAHRDTFAHMRQLAQYVRALPEGDLVLHSFARLAYMLPLLPTSIPKLQSYERAISPRSVRWGHLLSGGTLRFTACSARCAATGNVAGRWSVVHNGVPLETFPFRAHVGPDAPLVFLGRIEAIKGVHHAIEVARRTGRRLRIAGNVPEGDAHRAYAAAVFAACDGSRIEYVGPVDDAQKRDLLGSAAALLFPIEWEEPFGIVMAEALACGTPVVALRRGSVPEVVDDGVTGFACADVDEMIRSLPRIAKLDRAACRRAAEQRFSSIRMATQFEDLYREQLA